MAIKEVSQTVVDRLNVPGAGLLRTAFGAGTRAWKGETAENLRRLIGRFVPTSGAWENAVERNLEEIHGRAVNLGYDSRSHKSYWQWGDAARFLDCNPRQRYDTLDLGSIDHGGTERIDLMTR